jgi:hypothetical protein
MLLKYVFESMQDRSLNTVTGTIRRNKTRSILFGFDLWQVGPKIAVPGEHIDHAFWIISNKFGRDNKILQRTLMYYVDPDYNLIVSRTIALPSRVS